MAANITKQDGPDCILSHLPTSIAARCILFAFIAASQNPILTRQWLRHYQSLGVELRLSKVVVDTGGAKAAAVDETTRLFEARGVQVQLIAEYTSELKRSIVNRFIRSLPPDHLLIYPDSDELFD